MIVPAPAKINLCLHVTGQRTDGYHLLESVVYFSGACDHLTFSAASQDNLSVSGPFGALLNSSVGDNLVVLARDVLRLAAGQTHCAAVSIHLEKNLPLASGIGGGSADAAATLKALNVFWRLGFSNETLSKIALNIGADIPMCVFAQPLIAKGIGDIIEPIADFPDLPMLLVNPNIEVSTQAIFSELIHKTNGSLPRLPSMALRNAKNFTTWLRTTRNDLQGPACIMFPPISQALIALEDNGAMLARMSGSGATCYGIFKSQQDVHHAKIAIMAEHPTWWIT